MSTTSNRKGKAPDDLISRLAFYFIFLKGRTRDGPQTFSIDYQSNYAAFLVCKLKEFFCTLLSLANKTNGPPINTVRVCLTTFQIITVDNNDFLRFMVCFLSASILKGGARFHVRKWRFSSSEMATLKASHFCRLKSDSYSILFLSQSLLDGIVLYKE